MDLSSTRCSKRFVSWTSWDVVEYTFCMLETMGPCAVHILRGGLHGTWCIAHFASWGSWGVQPSVQCGYRRLSMLPTMAVLPKARGGAGITARCREVVTRAAAAGGKTATEPRNPKPSPKQENAPKAEVKAVKPERPKQAPQVL